MLDWENEQQTVHFYRHGNTVTPPYSILAGDMEQIIRITSMSLHIGGTRKFFLCPVYDRQPTTCIITGNASAVSNAAILLGVSALKKDPSKPFVGHVNFALSMTIMKGLLLSTSVAT
jgi:hypothetical protein